MKNVAKKDASGNAANGNTGIAPAATLAFAEAFAGYSVADNQNDMQSGDALLHINISVYKKLQYFNRIFL